MDSADCNTFDEFPTANIPLERGRAVSMSGQVDRGGADGDDRGPRLEYPAVSKVSAAGRECGAGPWPGRELSPELSEESPEMTAVGTTAAGDSFGEFTEVTAKKELHFAHLNVRSLLPKIDEIHMLVTTSMVGIFCLTETWLDDSISDSDISIDNYSLNRNDRNCNRGCVCDFVRSDVNYYVKSDLDNEDDIEVLLLDICLPKSKPVLLGVCYRPPNNNKFYESLEVLLHKCASMGRECVLFF